MSTELAEAGTCLKTTATEELAPKQAAALRSLLMGQTVTEAAKVVCVDRRTVHRWLSEDRAFRDAYRKARREIRRAAASSMETMAGNAIACLDEAILDGNVNAALQLLKGIGALRPAAGRNGRAAREGRAGEEVREHAR